MKGTELGRRNLKHRASLNLEMALLISLLVLAVAASLSWMAPGIANQFNSAAAALGVSGGSSSGPSDGSSSDNGDGSHEITWDDGVPPFDIVRSTQPDMSSPITIVEDIPDRSYTIQPIDLLPGDNFIDIIDGNGDRLPTPITITIPRDCYSYQDELLLAVGDFANGGGDLSVLDSRAVARGFLVPGYISGVAFDDATTCPDDGTPFTFIDGDFICVNHPPLTAADCDAYQTAIAQATYQWALAEVLPSTAKPIRPPRSLFGFYAEVLPYASTGRRQCALGDYTFVSIMDPFWGPEDGFQLYLSCASHPAPDAAVKRYCFVNQIAIEAAARNYHADHGVYPPSIGDLAADGYLEVQALSRLVFCPLGDPYTLNPDGTVADCSAGSPSHGHY